MYEVHITVNGVSKETFLGLCQTLKVKPLVIENDTGSGGITQLMTSRFYNNEYQFVLKEAKRCEEFLRSSGANVLRTKIEAVLNPHHTTFPANGPSVLYKEFHTKYEVSLDRRQAFLDNVSRANGHTSTNSLKNPNYIFVTTRDGAEHKSLKDSLSRESYIVRGEIYESVIYDTDPSIDSEWKTPEECMECSLKQKLNLAKWPPKTAMS